MKYRMIKRLLITPNTTAATVIGMLAVATFDRCPGASHHDDTVITVRASHTTVMVRADLADADADADADAVAGCVVTDSPHDVEQSEDDDPEQIDHVPVGGALLDH